LVSRQKDALDRAVAALLTRSIESKVVAGYLSDSTAIEGIGRAALACFGRVDILINAAGINLRESFESVTVDSWEQQINITSPRLCLWYKPSHRTCSLVDGEE